MALRSSISLDLIQTHSLLYGWVIFHCVFVQLLYPFIFQQRSRLLLCLQWTWQYMCFFQLLFSQGVCPVVGLLGHQIRSDQSLSRVRLFATPWIAARQASLSITNSRSSLRLMSIKSAMPSSHLILCHPLLLLPPIPPSISLFQGVNSSHEVAKVLEFQL